MNILVTGSSSGIGRALVERLVARGDTVWGLARSPQSPVAAGSVTAATGHLDGLVACAGVQGEIAPALAADPLRWSATVRTNLDGTYFPIRAFAPLLACGRRAKVVCLSGGGATKARANFSAYGAAKIREHGESAVDHTEKFHTVYTPSDTVKCEKPAPPPEGNPDPGE